MRARFILLVLAILLVAGFAAQNWGEITRSSLLNFGIVQQEAPLGLILLSLLGLALLVFALSAASLRTQSLVESRQNARALQAQRDLADKAEASRFTDLRQVLDSHLRESRQRESVVNTELERTMAQHQRELRNQLEQMYHLLTSRLSELERRLDSRGTRVSDPVIAQRVDPVASPARGAEPGPANVPPGRARV
ncbi:MAG TPA: hypothetical protein VFE82_09210 [Ramlibacter sp.]|jgi:uncharacterized integral membrane protein|uniref:hypothetical protein n=1 Tax=Ramlibacter sp. TaxID=1917967 RepID=UPI002D6913FA|nr:hypothetical protein [Ramlibacter sp.]HZY18649.1 hypothetical protein [Ramlibacter sp.]